MAHTSSRRDRTRTASPSHGPRTRPSLLLWRHRHLIVAVSVGAALVLALSILRPADSNGVEVLVLSRDVAAGEVLTDTHLETRSLPARALPEGERPTRTALLGTRAAVNLPRGTILTLSMTSAAQAVGLQPGERLVEVPVEIGANLAEPGAKVDIIGPAPVNPEDLEPTTEMTVLSHGARVVSVTTSGNQNEWISGRQATLMTVALSSSDASLVIGAATRDALGLTLSP